MTSPVTLAATTAAPPPADHHSTPVASATSPSPMALPGTSADTTGFWSSSDAPAVRDRRTDRRPDVPPTASPTAPRTYATTVRPARSAPSSARRDAQLPPTATDRLGRTQVIRRTEYGMTERDIIQTMTQQTGIPGHRLFESVLHDPRDRRRFYLTYATMDVKRDVMGRGFYLGGIHIRPTDDTIVGYIPFPPFYCDKQILDGLLIAYGTVTDGDFVRTEGGVRIAGYRFRLRPRQNATLPTTLTYNGYAMDIRRNDDIRYCTHCERYGHTTGRCRSRLADQESRQQQRRDLQLQRETQYQLEIDAINEREEAEHAEVNTQFEAETARIEADPSCDDTAELLLQELADKETSVTWLRERYAEMRSSVASHYNIPVDTPPDRADPLMDVDAALVPQGIPAGGADVATSVIPVAEFSPPHADPVGEISAGTPSTVHNSSEDDDEELSADEAPPVVLLPPPAVSPSPSPTSDQPAVVIPVERFSDESSVNIHVYRLPIVCIAPHRPLKPLIEEEVLSWLRLRRHDSSLAWEGCTLVFRTRCAIAESQFQRPAGQYTWTLGAPVAHFSAF